MLIPTVTRRALLHSLFLSVAPVLVSAISSAQVTYDDLAAGFEDPPLAARPDAFWTWLNGHADPARITEEMEAFKAAGFARLQVWDVKAHRDPDGIVPLGPAFLSDAWLENLRHANREALRLGLELGLVAASGWNAGGTWVEPERAGLAIYSSEVSLSGPESVARTLAFPSVPEHSPKAADGRPAYWETVAVQAVPAPDGKPFDGAAVIDLTGKLDAEGRLRCELPAGEWTLRWFIRANSGQRLIVPSPNSDGLQIDFFDPENSRWYFHHVCDRLESALGSLEESALVYLEVDSLELEGGRLSAWTEDILREFEKRYGYDATPYLSLLVEDRGEVVGASGERFLREWTRLISDLMIESHYRVGSEVLEERGLQLSAEAGGPGPPIWNSCPVDAIGALGATSLVRGEFWPKQRSMYNVKEIACAAHVYGKRIVDAESFTSWRHWRDLPYYLKLLSDQAFLDGLNHITFHTAPHGGAEAGLPGYAYHAGTHIGPNLVWWPMAKPFIDYLSRCSFLLQQGTPIADVCFYQGSSAPVFHPLGVDWDPVVRPAGFDYDVIDVRQLVNALEFRAGRLRLPSGVSYRMLVLPKDQELLPEVAAKVARLAEAGARIVGPGYRDGPLIEALTQEVPDFGWEGGDERTRLGFVHRRGDDFEVYYVVNQNERWESVRAMFRPELASHEMEAEVWDPSSGSMEVVPWESLDDNQAAVALTLPPGGSRFVVLRSGGRGPIVPPASLELTQLERRRGARARADVAHGDAPNGPAWLSSGESPPSAEFIVYDLGAKVPLCGADVSNYQDQTRGLLTRGVKRMKVSVAGSSGEFESLGEFDLRRAPDIGERDCEERLTWSPREARFVKLEVLSNHSDDWSGHTQVVGLNRIRFLGAAGEPIEEVRLHGVSSGVAHDPCTGDLRADRGPGLRLAGPWDLTLRSPFGEEESLVLTKLASWTEPDCPVPQHFSGSCVYETTFEAQVQSRAVELDLGRLAGVAHVWVNDVDLGIVWHPPYAVDVTDALVASGNRLRVEVVNTWHNRLVGDAALAPEERKTVTNIRGPFTAETPLVEAGLIGPVTLVSSELSLPRPTETQLAWQAAELGVVFHYDLHVCGDGRYVQSRNRVEPIDDVNRFAPEALDTDQWVRAAKAAGATFAVLTGSHETGFRLWQSDANPYCLSAVRWGDGKRDIVAEFHASCLRYGLKPGIYLGTRWNSQLGVYDFKVTERSPLTQDEYNRLIEAEVTEICTRYGDWFEFWFDGGAHGPDQGGPDVLSIVEEHQPAAVFYHNLQRADARWGGSESGTVGYPCWASFPYPATGSGESARAEISADGFRLLKHGDPNGRYWLPAMSDAPLRGSGGHEWFWEPDQDGLLYPVEKLVDMYCRSVGRNSTLILGLTPDDRGLLPDADVERLAEFGDDVRSMLGDLAGVRGPELSFENGSQPVDLVVIQEDIRWGERVRRYHVEASVEGEWRTIADGSCIGHKRIHRLEAPVVADGIRVVVDEFAATPRILTLRAGLTAQEGK